MFEFRDYIGNEYTRGLLQGIVLKGFDPYFENFGKRVVKSLNQTALQ